MPAIPTVGTIVAVSASIPATFDATAYTALSWTTVGEVVECAPPQQTWELATHAAIARAYDETDKVKYAWSNFTFKYATIAADAGQDILNTGLPLNTQYSFRITVPSGPVFHLVGKIIKLGPDAYSQTGHEYSMCEVIPSHNTIVRTGI